MKEYTYIKIIILLVFTLLQSNAIAQYNDIIIDLRINSYNGEKEMLNFGDSILLNNNDKLLKERILLYYSDFYLATNNQNKRDSVLTLVSSKPNISKRALIIIKLKENEININKGEYDGSLNDCKILLDNAVQLNDTSLAINVLNQIGTIYKKTFIKDSSFYYFTKALDLAKNSNDLLAQSNLLSNIGSLKSDANQYDEALELYERGYQIADKNNLLWIKRNINNNLATIYLVNREYNKAKNLLTKLIIDDKNRNATDRLPVYWLNLASVYYELEEYQLAITYYDSCKVIFKENNQKVYAQVLYLIAKSQYAINNYDLALTNITESIEIASKSGALNILTEVNLLASIIYEKEGSHEKSLVHYKNYNRINDSIYLLANQKVLLEMEVKYEVHEKEKEKIKSDNIAKILQKEKEVNNFKFKIYLGLIIILFIFIAIIYILRQKRKRHEEFSQELMKSIDIERNRIALDLHDDIGQLLSLMKNKVHIAIKKDKNNLEEVEESISIVIEKTRKISRNLYPAQIKSLGLVKSVTNLLEEVENECDILCTHSIDSLDEKLNADTKMHLFRILQECISNTIKHANATAIKVQMFLIDNGLEVIYQDNGRGMSAASTNQGMGILSIKERVKILKGEMGISNNGKKGFIIKLKFINI